MSFIQRSAGRSDSVVQPTNNFNQRRKGNLGGQNCSNREHEFIRRPNILTTCFTCRRYTVKSHAWENQQHACYYGGTPKRRGPSFGTSFCSILRPFLTTLLHPQVAEFAASISFEDAKCEIASLSNTCGLHMLKQRSTREALLSEAGFEKVFRTQNWVRRSKLFCK